MLFNGERRPDVTGCEFAETVLADIPHPLRLCAQKPILFSQQLKVAKTDIPDQSFNKPPLSNIAMLFADVMTTAESLR
jgi:hypothetical protein